MPKSVAPKPSLEGPLAKLRRAREHVDELEGYIGSRLRGQTYHLAHQFDADSRVYKLLFEEPPAMPPEFGVRIGDAVHNLRSALDHLVWQLIRANGRNPKQQPASPQFPIYAAKPVPRDDWDPWARIEWVSPPARTFIEGFQPYQPGNGGIDDPLAVLQKLSNRDKHRVIVPVYLGHEFDVEPVLSRLAGSPDVGPIDLPFYIWPGGVLKERTVIARFRLVRPGASRRCTWTLRFRLA
jgi:hypothetical protein